MEENEYNGIKLIRLRYQFRVIKDGKPQDVWVDACDIKRLGLDKCQSYEENTETKNND